MKNKLREVIIHKDFGGKEIIAEVGLAVIAVALIIVFRGEINTLLSDLIGAAHDKISTLFDIS